MDFEDGDFNFPGAPSSMPCFVGGGMSRIPLLRSVAVAIGAFIAVTACGPGNQPTSENLAADQTLRFSMINDVTSLDPAHVDAAVDITYLAEVFTGLYKFDNNLTIVPDGATALPDISADGKTWTFKLRHDVKFSNGDKVTSADWAWS